MKKIRFGVVLFMLLCPASYASAQIRVDFGLPDIRIGINLPEFPELVPVPGYPVYYAPRMDANYFFYDGLYWVYLNDNWYASYWYNGPWWLVEPVDVPLFILRIPVSYYRHPPAYFRGWRANAPPRWDEHWGRGWEQRRRGWDKWQKGSAPARAPLPLYQRKYSGDRYPRLEQQQTLRSQHYYYQPRDKAVRQQFLQPGVQRTPAPAQRGLQEEPPVRIPRQQEIQRPAPLQQGGPANMNMQPPHQQPPRLQPPPLRVQPPQQLQPDPQQRGPAIHEQSNQPGAVQHEQRTPGPQGQEQRLQEREGPQEPGRGQGEGPRREEERGR